jgi:type II secretory pathway pseudopilin PulG
LISLERVRGDDGFGLIELTIAMLVLSIAIMAIFAGFSSGALALQRASRASTAATVADRKMEEFRRISYSSIPAPSSTTTTVTGPEGHAYWMSTNVSYTCVVGTLSATTPPACIGGAVASRPVKLVTIVVRDGSAAGRMLMRETSTFDAATGS